MLRLKKKAKGSALLTALFIMALVAIVATAMSAKLQVDIYRTRLIRTRDTLYLASHAITLWSISELNDPANMLNRVYGNGIISQYPHKQNRIDSKASLSGELYDLQARYNLNNLSNKKAVLAFANFLTYIFPKITVAEKMHLTSAIIYWVSTQVPNNDSQNFESYYHHLTPAYNPSHQFMSSSSELRLIKGINTARYLALEPYVTALPEPTPLNVVTASMPALMTLSTVMTEEAAQDIIKARQVDENGVIHFEKINGVLKNLNISNDQFTVESVYFLSVAHASIENIHITVYTVLKRSHDKNGASSVSIIRQSINNF